MDWRKWVWETLEGWPELGVDGIYAANSLQETPAVKPFIVLAFGGDETDLAGFASTGTVTAWVHDELGSYRRIDAIISEIHKVLVGSVPFSGAVLCEWMGSSPDLMDDQMGTGVRNTMFRLVGRTEKEE